jgi:hypothetical protein
MSSRENTMTTNHKALPENLYAAHQWISAAGEWNEAVADPEKYASEAAANAAENEQFDVHESDLLSVIAWHKAQN